MLSLRFLSRFSVVGRWAIVVLVVVSGACVETHSPPTRALIIDVSGVTRLEVDITYATTAEERQEGLSALPPLGEWQGLLIRFPIMTEVCIHNGPVAYPIDAVFMDDGGDVVAVERSMAAFEVQARCHPGVRDVLELRAGVASDVHPGMAMVLSQQPF